jgi:peptidyl-prolyl cis-trans isomerase B (cyclophilin B)
MQRTGIRVAWLVAGLLVGSETWSAAQPARPKQAVVETSAGRFIIDLKPELAPRQTALFTKLADDGSYVGTTFFRMVRHGLVQGGDPLTKDPSKQKIFGSGGFNQVKAEPRAPKVLKGAVAAVLLPGKPDSAGAQFFVVTADQPGLDGQYTVFGEVAEGLDVVQAITETPVDATGVATARVEIRGITIRDTPPPVPEPFSTEQDAELGRYRAFLETSLGTITLEVFPDKAPVHVRQFFKMARGGIYDKIAFHRVAPGFVIQTGALGTRSAPLTPKQQALVVNLPPEFSDTKHVKGIVSMARGDDPTSATTSFFICTGTSTALDGKYTVFARVVDGLSVVEAIEAVPRTGESPNERVELTTNRIEQPAQ